MAGGACCEDAEVILACASEGLLAVAGLLAMRLMWVNHRLTHHRSRERDPFPPHEGESQSDAGNLV